MNEPIVIDVEELKRHAGWIRGLAERLLKDEHLASDVVQETWLAWLRSPPERDRPVQGWLARVVRNQALHRRRGDLNRTVREEVFERSRQESPSAAEVVERLESHRLLVEELLRLNDPLRSTLVLRYFDGLEPRDIARRLGVPAGTVRWRLNEGLDRLRRRLEERFHGKSRSWSEALLPLVGSGDTVVLPLFGALIMNAKLALGALVIAAAAVLFWVLPDSPEETPSNGSHPAVVQHKPSIELPGAPERTNETSEAVVREVLSVGDEAVSATAAILTGRLLGPGGQPLGTGRIAVEGEEWVASCDSQGRAQLSVPLSAGEKRTLVVWCVAPGYVRHVEDVVLRCGDTVALGDVTLGPGGRVLGRVVDDNGLPVSGARVFARDSLTTDIGDHLRRQGPDEGFLRLRPVGRHWPSTVTDSRGAFELEGVRLGDVSVWARKDGSLYAGVACVAVRLDTPVSNVEILLGAESVCPVVEGRVLYADGRPALGSLLKAVRRTQDRWAPAGRATAGENGTFRIELDRDGVVDLAVASADGCEMALLSAVKPGTQRLTLTLSPARFVEIAAVDPAGAPIENFGVVVSGPLTPRQRLGQPTDGEAPGVRKVPLGADDTNITVLAEGFLAESLPSIPPDHPGGRITCSMKRAFVVRGRVVTTAGDPVPNARVRLLNDANGLKAVDGGFRSEVRLFISYLAQTSADGRFALELPNAPDMARLRADHDGYAAARLQLPLYTELPAEGLTLVLTDGGTLEGRVIGAPEQPAEGTVVAVADGLADIQAQRVGEDGRFRFEHLAPGNWQVARARTEAVELESIDLGQAEGSMPAGHSMVRRKRVKDDPSGEVEIREGQVSRFDLDLNGPAAAALRGALFVDGEPAGGILLTLNQKEASVGDSSRDTTDGKGRFYLSYRRPGTAELRLLSPLTPTGSRLFMRAAVQLVPGETERVFQLRTGKVGGRIANAGKERLVLFCTPLPETSFQATVKLAEDGRFELDGIPAGPARIARFEAGKNADFADDWPTVSTLQVIAGRTVEVDLSLPEQ